VGVVGQANNQALAPKPTRDQKCAQIVSKGTFIKSVVNSCSTKRSIKEAYG